MKIGRSRGNGCAGTALYGPRNAFSSFGVKSLHDPLPCQPEGWRVGNTLAGQYPFSRAGRSGRYDGAMSDAPATYCCPKCHGADVEVGALVVAYDPLANLTFPDGALRPEVIERKFRCRGCGLEFSVVERPDE